MYGKQHEVVEVRKVVVFFTLGTTTVVETKISAVFFLLINGRKSLSGESDTMSLRLLEPEVALCQ